MDPLGIHSVEPARTGPFMFARQTPSGPEAIQKLDTTKAKKKKKQVTSGRDCRGGRLWLASALLSLTTWNQIININSQPVAAHINSNSRDLSCGIHPSADVLYCQCGFSAASRFNFTPSGLLRGIYVWWVKAGNFNAQLIRSLNKWGSSSTFHSWWQVTWVAELWVCQHAAGKLDLMERWLPADAPNQGIILDCLSHF